MEVAAQTYRCGRGGTLVRPFASSAGVSCRCYSRGLPRVMTDFGAADSFAEAVQKVQEHYGVAVPQSALRVSTQHHAQAMREAPQLADQLPEGGVARVIAEADGCFVPVVEMVDREGEKDKRKLRKVDWREARLALARKEGASAKHYQATMSGVAHAGAQLLDCVISVGAGQQTKIHCVGDGARWIVRQVAEQLGARASYLTDFYHVSDYLARAAEAIGGKAEKKEWLKEQQQRMKENRVSEVLAELRPHLERAEVEETEAPVRVCDRYIANRMEYLDYQGAIEAGLPIGSGEIESGHRCVIQARLKISGAWWKEENAEKMLRLRTVRANGEWESYWGQLRQAAA